VYFFFCVGGGRNDRNDDATTGRVNDFMNEKKERTKEPFYRTKNERRTENEKEKARRRMGLGWLGLVGRSSGGFQVQTSRPRSSTLAAIPPPGVLDVTRAVVAVRCADVFPSARWLASARRRWVSASTFAAFWASRLLAFWRCRLVRVSGARFVDEVVVEEVNDEDCLSGLVVGPK